MFENLLKSVEAIDGMRVPVPINADEDGYSDRECPFEDCEFQFKVFAEDWKSKFKDESVFCPFCGHNSSADNFWTKLQVQQAKSKALEYAKNEIGKALRDGAAAFNRSQQRGGFITMSMQYKGQISNDFIMPIEAQKELEQKITCSQCDARYSILGNAFFCPCCGYNSVDETFENAIRKIESKMKNLEIIRDAIAEINLDEAELTVRSLIEWWLSDIVVAFQRFCETTYKEKTNNAPLKANIFQNLEIGWNLWKDLLGFSYMDWLNEEDFNNLNISFQKRHLLSHQEGMVDEKYLQKTKDEKYKKWQRIVVKKEEVLNAVKLIREIVSKIRENVKVS